MGELSEGSQTLTIYAAHKGGYVVRDCPAEAGMLTQTLFAGSLDDCLKFMRETIAKHVEQAQAPSVSCDKILRDFQHQSQSDRSKEPSHVQA